MVVAETLSNSLEQFSYVYCTVCMSVLVYTMCKLVQMFNTKTFYSYVYSSGFEVILVVFIRTAFY